MKNDEYINDNINEAKENNESVAEDALHTDEAENIFEAVSVNLFGEVDDGDNEKGTVSEAEENGEASDASAESPALFLGASPDTNGDEEENELICEDLIAPDSDGIENGFEPEVSLDEAEDGSEPSSDEDNLEDESEEDSQSEGTDGENTEEKSENDAAAAKKPRRVDTIFDFIEICIFTLAGMFVLMSFFFRYSIVDGDSMMNTLQHQDRLLITNFLYTPECGDIVVVQDKSTILKDPIVKRIIAVGGQKVKITRTEIYVDGIKLPEPYVYTGDYTNPFGASDEYRYSVYPSDELLDLVVDYIDGVYYEILVPEGEIFVMGDHRNNSTDSRVIGTLHEDAIIGKAIYRFFPFDKAGKIE